MRAHAILPPPRNRRYPTEGDGNRPPLSVRCPRFSVSGPSIPPILLYYSLSSPSNANRTQTGPNRTNSTAVLLLTARNLEHASAAETTGTRRNALPLLGERTEVRA